MLFSDWKTNQHYLHLYIPLSQFNDKRIEEITESDAKRVVAWVLSQSTDHPEYLLSVRFGTYDAPCDAHKNWHSSVLGGTVTGGHDLQHHAKVVTHYADAIQTFQF